MKPEKRAEKLRTLLDLLRKAKNNKEAVAAIDKHGTKNSGGAFEPEALRKLYWDLAKEKLKVVIPKTGARSVPFDRYLMQMERDLRQLEDYLAQAKGGNGNGPS